MVDVEKVIEKINIESIVPADYNPRIISDEDYANLKKSIDEFGLVSPIVINLEDCTIISGHQRFDVLYYENNISELYLLKLGDIGWVFTETDLTIKDKNYEKALNLAMNRIHGEFDVNKVDVILSDLQELKLDSLTGFDLELDEIDYDFISRLDDESDEEYDDVSNDNFDDKIIDDSYEEDEIEKTFEKTELEKTFEENKMENNRIRRGFIKYGDVYKIGDSFLMFGKSDSEQDRTKLLNSILQKNPINLPKELIKIKSITKEINYYMCYDADLIESIIIENKKISKKIG